MSSSPVENWANSLGTAKERDKEKGKRISIDCSVFFFLKYIMIGSTEFAPRGPMHFFLYFALVSSIWHEPSLVQWRFYVTLLWLAVASDLLGVYDTRSV